MPILDDNSAANIRSGLNVTGSMKRNWMITAKWAMFFAILGFIYIAFVLLSIGSVGRNMQAFSALMGDSPEFGALAVLMPYITVFSVLVVAVSFFINFFHLRFSLGIQKAVNLDDQRSFVNAWLSMRNFMRIAGIFVAVVLVVYVIAVVFAVSFIASMGSSHY